MSPMMGNKAGAYVISRGTHYRPRARTKSSTVMFANRISARRVPVASSLWSGMERLAGTSGLP